MTFQVQTPNGGSDFLGFQNFSGTNIAKITAADASANALTITTGNSGTTAAMFDTNQNATMNYVSAQNTFGFKNRIINGAMVIDQRNAGASVTPTDGQYDVDRWCGRLTQASKFTLQQTTNAPVGFNYSLKATSSSAYSVGSGDFFAIEQWIEGFNCADLGWGTANPKTVTLSFQVYSSLTGTFGGSLRTYAGGYSYPFSYSIPVANTWTTVSVTVTGATAGTWNTTNSGCIGVAFSLGAGSSFSGTAGAWAANTYFQPTGATSVVGTNGATFYITGVQLEKGSIATPFDYRDYGRELIMCQRYFCAIGGTASDNAIGAGFGAGTSIYANGFYPVQMRSAPTLSYLGSLSNTFVTTTSIGGTVTGITNYGNGVNGWYATLISSSSFPSYSYVMFRGNANFYLTASAEL
jgi:hypothetical protein